jgi:hypothetical protein
LCVLTAGEFEVALVYVLTAGELEVALVLVQRELAELHGFAHNRDVTPKNYLQNYKLTGIVS